jgi:hypothetical protein
LDLANLFIFQQLLVTLVNHYQWWDSLFELNCIWELSLESLFELRPIQSNPCQVNQIKDKKNENGEIDYTIELVCCGSFFPEKLIVEEEQELISLGDNRDQSNKATVIEFPF